MAGCSTYGILDVFARLCSVKSTLWAVPTGALHGISLDMRGISIQKPLEFRLEVPVEFVKQGDSVPCSLTVKNHGSEPVALSSLSLRLALGNLKKVKAKGEDAFQDLAQAEVDRAGVIAPGADAAFSWSFAVEKNSPISDKNQSPYLLYGNSDSDAQLGQLPLTVKMHPHYQAIFDTCETVLSLINKGESWKDGYTSVKFKAPDLRKFSLVDEIVISVRFVDDSLELVYSFKVKKLEATSTNLNFKKGKAEVVQTWSAQQYLFGGGFIRQEFIEKMLDEALSVVATGF